MPYQTLQYQIKAEPIPLGAAETTTPDKWLSQTQTPIRKAGVLVALAASAAFVPVVSAASAEQTYVSGQNCEPIARQSFQYESEARPLSVSAAPPETITPDKWVVRIEQPRPGIKRRQWLYPSFFGEQLHVAPTTPSAQVYIPGQSPGPITRLTFQYPSEAKPVFIPTAAPETVTLDKWLGQWPQPRFRTKRLTQYGINCAIAEQADDGIPPTYWIPPVSQPYPRRRLPTREGFSVTARLDVVPAQETVTLDKWAQPTERSRWDRRRFQRLYPVSVADQLFNVPAVQTPAVYISGSAPGPIVIQRFQYPDIARPVVITVETVTIDRWHRLSSTPAFKRKRSSDYSHFSIDPTPRVERASVDKWGQQTNWPRFDVKRNLWLYPSFASDSRLNVSPGVESVWVDKWGQETQRPRFDLKKFRVYPTAVSDYLGRVPAIPSSWLQPQSLPRRELRRLQHLYPNLSFELVIVPPVISEEAAVWQNLGTVTLNAADLASVTLLLENLGDPALILFENTDVAVLITENIGAGDVMHEDDDTAVINYEDSDTV